VEDSEDDVRKAFMVDRANSNDFFIHSLIKDSDDANNTLKLLVDNFEYIKVWQKEMMFGSSKYPQIDWDRIWTHIDYAQQNAVNDLPKNK
jgi:hypothetical protein